MDSRLARSARRQLILLINFLPSAGSKSGIGGGIADSPTFLLTFLLSVGGSGSGSASAAARMASAVFTLFGLNGIKSF